MAANTHETSNKSAPVEHRQTHSSHPFGATAIAIAVGAGIVLLLIGTIAGFAASRLFGHGDFDDRAGMFGRHRTIGGMPGRMMAGTVGKVTSVSSSSITLTDNRSGGAVTFKIDSSTSVVNSNGDAAKAGDIKVGDTVSVRGTGATGDTLASRIVINPTPLR